MPFKVIGAPWIKADDFAIKLNALQLPGVTFVPYHFQPFYGRYKGEDCHGVLLNITNSHTYRPLYVQYLLLGMLKSLYPKEFQEKIKAMAASKKELFCKANGNEEMWKLLSSPKEIAWQMILFQKEEREHFKQKRKRYLLY